MTDLSPDARALLDAARGSDEPTDADRRRVKAAVMLSVASIGASSGAAAATEAAKAGGMGEAASGSALTATTGSAASATVSAKLAALAIGGVLVSAGAGIFFATRPSPSTVAPPASILTSTLKQTAEPPPPPALEAPPTAVADSGDKPPARPKRAPSQEAVPSPPASPPSPSVSGKPSFSEAETSALRAIRSALRTGDAASAHRSYIDYETRFPDGVLREEATGLHVDVLCALGRIDEATAAATAFAQAYPASPHLPRVTRGCKESVP